MDKKRWTEKWCQYVDNFGDIDKKRFIKNDNKKRSLSRNVDIYGYIDKKRFFQNDRKIKTFFSKYW